MYRPKLLLLVQRQYVHELQRLRELAELLPSDTGKAHIQGSIDAKIDSAAGEIEALIKEYPELSAES